MKKTIFLAAALLSLAACNKAVLNAPVECGFIKFNVSSDDVVVVDTRAVTSEELDAYNVFCNGFVLDTYGNLKGKTSTRTVGDYVFYAENITELDAETGFGALRVASEPTTVTVNANETATATLACVAQSSKLNVTFDSSFTGVFTDYAFVIKETDNSTRADGKAAITVDDTNAGTDIFYNGSVNLTYTITGTHGVLGAQTFGGTLSLTKGHSLAVKVKQSTESGGLKIEVSADDSLITDTDKNVTVDPYNPSTNL